MLPEFHIPTLESGQFNIDLSNQHWWQLPIVFINSPFGHGVYESDKYSGNLIEIDGQIDADSSGVSFWGNKSIVQMDGTINAEDGVTAFGTNQLVTNNGDIYATNRGILENGANNKIVNNALIAANYGIVADGGSTITNGKQAYIEAQKVGVEVDSNLNVATTITNKGQILGKEFAFVGQGGNETLVNRGTLFGKVDLGGGNDKFDNVGGIVKAGEAGGTGSVYGGAGNDTYSLNSSAIKIVENAGGGQDLVKSSITYKLGSGEIEDLTLTGSAAINGTGNGIGNHLTGNSGKNTLSGSGGNDVLNGMKGTDILTGGSGADTFVFATGHGKDTVTDFKNGTDHFDLKHFDAVTSFLDLKLHHLTVSGDDLIISYGTDKLVIADTAKAELDASDFFF